MTQSINCSNVILKITHCSTVELLLQFHHAAVVYRKLGKIEEASRAFEDGLNFGQAVEVLVNVAMFDKAIDAVERYHITLKVQTIFLLTHSLSIIIRCNLNARKQLNLHSV